MKTDVLFQGGGAKGLAHVGAMKAFFEADREVGRLVGTSAGAMTAGLLAAGFSPDDLKKAALERLPDGRPVFASFMDAPTQLRILRLKRAGYLPFWKRSAGLFCLIG